MSDTESHNNEPQDEAAGPKSGDVLALGSNVSQEDIAPDASQGALVNQIVANCNMLSKILMDTHQNVDRVEAKVDSLSLKVGELARGRIIDTGEYAKFFECAENKMVSRRLSSAEFLLFAVLIIGANKLLEILRELAD